VHQQVTKLLPAMMQESIANGQFAGYEAQARNQTGDDHVHDRLLLRAQLAQLVKVVTDSLPAYGSYCHWRLLKHSLLFVEAIGTGPPDPVSAYRGRAGLVETWRARQAPCNFSTSITLCALFTMI
jgi:hypothetical protein